MQSTSTIENLSDLERKLTVVVPLDFVNNEIKKKLNEFARSAKIDGFRPGKIPFAIIQKRYGTAIRGEVLEKITKDTCYNAIEKNNLNIVNYPKIEILTNKSEEDFSYAAFFEVFPKIKLIDSSEIVVEKTISEITEEDINEAIEDLRKKHIVWDEANDKTYKAKAGDQLTIDFSITLPEGNSKVEQEKEFKFVLGDGSMWQDFEKPLYDVSTEETKKYTVKFPASHLDKNLSEKEAECEVVVHKVCKPVLPQIDNEFIKNKLGVKDGSLDSLKQEIRKQLELNLQENIKKILKQNISNKLLELYANMPLPKSLVDNELNKIADVWKEHLDKTSDKSFQQTEFPRKDFDEQARKNVSLSLLLQKIITDNKIEIKKQELEEKARDLIIKYGIFNKNFVSLMSNDKFLSRLEDALLEERAFDYLTSKFKVVDKRIDYKDLKKTANR